MKVLYGYKKAIVKFVGVMLAIMLALTCFTACVSTEKGYSGYGTDAGKNQSKVLRIFGTWTKTGIGTHYNCGADAGPFVIFGLEGLAQYVRTTDEIVMLLAESFTHEGNTTKVKLRDDAYWHDGEPVVSMDIIGCWYLNHDEATSYMESVTEIDDKNFLITWKSYLTPAESARDILLAQATKIGSTPYHIFKEFVDEAIELTNSLEQCPETSTSRNSSYFDKNWNGDAATAFGEIYTAYRAYEVDGVYPATGPYKLESYTETQMTLVKNENYYLADTCGFERIEVTYQPTAAVANQMLAAGQVDYVDGTPLQSVLESILQQNGSLVHYKILDQGTVGCLFNLEKEIWASDIVREAFQYVFDRELIKNTANPYAATSWHSMSTMCSYEAEKWLDPDDYDKLAEYYYDQSKAAELLEQAGWSKADGAWQDENGNKVSLTLGYVEGTPWTAMATTVQALLKSFGIEVILKSTESPTTLLANARITDSEYDFMLYFTALNPWGSHPGGAFKHMYSQMDAAMMHLPVNESDGHYSLVLNKADGSGTFRAWDVFERIYTYSGSRLREVTADLVVGFAEMNYGIDFYDNVTGSFFNLDTVGNLPLQELFSEDRNITTLYYYNDADYDNVQKLNLYYTQATSYSTGVITPRG